MTDELFRDFMKSITAAMNEEEKEYVRERLDEAVKDPTVDEDVRIAVENAYLNWLFTRDGEAAKRVLLGLLVGDEK